MREIKFRVWGRFYCYRKWQMLDVREMLFYTNSSVSIACFNKKSGKIGTTALRYGSILLQYTGSKDKNGKEIYEGDILKYTGNDSDDSSQILGYVIFEKGCFRYVEIGTNAEHDNEVFYNEILEDDEIIGNIYENPELLKKI